jgi:hypothetical protein
MDWASHHIQKLRVGDMVALKPHGHSMTGRIESGQLCTAIPIDSAMFEVGNIEVGKVANNEYPRIAKAIQDGR